MKKNKNINLEDLLSEQKRHNPKANIKKIEEVYEYAKLKHSGQKRDSGEEYIIHPLNVAYILSELGFDDETIYAALLHDTLEDTDATKEEIVKLCGESVYDMVMGVTKLGKLGYSSKKEAQVENYRKMFLAMGKDIRVIIIKFADRLHNLRTLGYKEREKQIIKAKETLDIYAPLANRLGIYSFKSELEDLSFRYLYPDEFYKLVNNLKKKQSETDAFLESIKKGLESNLKKYNVKAEVQGRVKKYYSIYKKMLRDNKDFDQIYDIFAFRIIVDTVEECYKVLGIVHEAYVPLSRRFKDYIAVPKQNMYQSIHTTVIPKISFKKKDEAVPFEIQIRTHEMDEVAEYGVAAHWAYKEENYKGKKSVVKAKEDKLKWVRDMIDWQSETKDPDEFMDQLKVELIEDEVYVYTPAGDIKSCPKGAVPIDLAYLIHEDIGNKMIGARINTKIVPIDTPMKNGDIVEILTSDTSKGPSADWLDIVKSPNAKNRIKKWFKKVNKEQNKKRGEEFLVKEIKKLPINTEDIYILEWVNEIAKKIGFENTENMYAAIGFGGLKTSRVINLLKEKYKEVHKDEILDEKINKLRILDEDKNKSKKTKVYTEKEGIYVPGIDNVLINIAKCCMPVPGDDIIGYITQGRGVTVHRRDCLNINKLLENDLKIINVEWAQKSDETYIVELEIKSAGKKDLARDVISEIEQLNIELIGLTLKENEDGMVSLNLKVTVEDIDYLNKLITKLKGIQSVISVERKRG